jgi:hypothetical protein
MAIIIPEDEDIIVGKVIYAKTIFNRFQNIFEQLIGMARSNLTKLKEKISAINTAYGKNVKDYYSFKYIDTNVPREIENLFNNLDALEKSWKDVKAIDSNFPEDGHILDATHPLHLKERTVTRESGKVRKNDYIAAYNFKGFMESLYAIVSEIRNISFQCVEDGTYVQNRSWGERDKYASYQKMALTSGASPTSLYSTATSANLLKSIISFNDFILNNDSKGAKVYTPDETIGNQSDGNHGYVGTSLVPSNVDLNSDKAYINTNAQDNYKFGHQVTRHFTSGTVGDFDTKTTIISNYYNSPGRNVSQGTGSGEFDYKTDPSCGISKEYLSIKPAKTKPSQNQFPSDFDTVKNTISKYFNASAANTKIIRSKKAIGNWDKKKVIITASVVNNLFKDLNILAVKILASLCGEYRVPASANSVANFPPPLAGLGYPNVFSWYYGSDKSSFYLGRNQSGFSYYSDYNSTLSGKQSALRKNYNGILNNGREIGTEDYERNKPIRTGLPYFYNPNATAPMPVQTTMLNILRNSHSPCVPMSFNRFVIQNNTTGKSVDDVIASNSFKRNMLYGCCIPWENYTMEIKPLMTCTPSDHLSTAQYAVNRYCASHPRDLDTFNDESAIGRSYESSEISTLAYKNVNNRFMFMPYMTWLTHISYLNNSKVYNGKIVEANGTYTDVSLGVGPRGQINFAAGIPVTYEERQYLWTPSRISYSANVGMKAADVLASNLYGSAQLKLNRVSNGSLKKITDSNINIDWFEYKISCGMTVNEINHTHTGYHNAYFYIGDGSVSKGATIQLDYGNRETAASFSTTHLGDIDGVTSTIYHGLNWYNVQSLGESSTYKNVGMTDFVGDAINTLMGNRFKFNDFYSDWNPLGTNSEIKNAWLDPFFTVGPENDYVEGNATRGLSWVTRISGNHNNMVFAIRSSISQTAGEKDGTPNIAQCGFFASGNMSNRVCIDGVQYEYKLIPQPSPVDLKSIYLYYNGNAATPTPPEVRISANCKYLWNNAEYIDVYIKAKKGSQAAKEFSKRLSPRDGIRTNPSADYKLYPLLPTRPYQSRKYIDSNGLYAGEISAEHQRTAYRMNLKATFPELLDYLGETGTATRKCSCAIRIFNENGGFRDVCKAKNKTDISAGYFEISVAYTPYEPPAPPTGVLNYEYESDPNRAIVLGRNVGQTTRTINIPSTTTSGTTTYPVEEISANAFYNTDISSVSIPSSVTIIDDTSFAECNDIVAVSSQIYETTISTLFPDAYDKITSYVLTDEGPCTVITTSMFDGCIQLRQMAVPGTVTDICASAFNGCSRISSFATPAGLRTIGDNAFKGCSNISSIDLQENEQYLTSIGQNAFENCTSLSSIAIPGSVDVIDVMTFKNCTNLEEVILKDGVKDISTSAFESCSELSSFEVPNTLEAIGPSAFYNCSDLSSFVIPSSVVSVGTNAFENTKIKKIYYDRIYEPEEETTEAALQRLKEVLLVDCGLDLTLVTFEDRNPPTPISWSLDIRDNGVVIQGMEPYPSGDLMLPNTFNIGDTELNVIGIDDSFIGQSQVTSVTVPVSTKFIGRTAFSGCSSSIYANTTQPTGYKTVDGWLMGFNNVGQSIQNVNLEIKVPGSENYIKGVANEAFRTYDADDLDDPEGTPINYRTITAVSTGNHLTTVPSGLFRKDVGIKSISIGNQITSIENDAFRECSGFTSLSIPNNVITIGDNAFKDCTNLETLSLGNGLTNISKNAFENCAKLSSLTIPSSLQQLNEDSFYGCHDLSEINFEGNSQITAIPPYCFSMCESLPSVVLPDSVKLLDHHSFKNDTSLISVGLNKVEEIGECAFEGCSNLSSVTIPTTVTAIYKGPFAKCASLTSIVVESGNDFYTTYDDVLFRKEDGILTQYPVGKINNVYSIPSSVDDNNIIKLDANSFYGASNIVQLTIPSTVKEIDTNAFSECTSLNKIIIDNIDNWCNIKFENISANPICNSNNCKLWLNSSVVSDLSNVSYEVTSIGGYSFATYKQFKNLIFSTYMKEIGEYAFSECTELSSIYVPSGITSIGENAFYRCTNLTTISYIVDQSETPEQADERIHNLFSLSGIDTEHVTFIPITVT